MKRYLTFDDVLIAPKFSHITSREDCFPVTLLGKEDGASRALDLPLISANMDTITGANMARTMADNGAIGALHRFCTIEENVEMLKEQKHCFVSFGASDREVDRAMALYESGAYNFILDVAHGASVNALKAYNNFRLTTKSNSKIHVMVGNFATAESINEFVAHTIIRPDSIKVGIGGGSMCTTRIVTGVGVPTLGSVIECVETGYHIVADGGIRNSGDVAKCLVAGAKAVMVGSMLAGTEETPGQVEMYNDIPHKVYRGSASKESYEVQNKVAKHRTAEGVSTYVKYKGSVVPILDEVRAGILSCMSYVDANTIDELRENGKFIEITASGMRESHAHGKR